MALFTGKGDDGTTYAFDCDQRFSKSSATAEALGALDEVNSFLGFCKIRSKESNYYLGSEYPSFEHIVHLLQEGLFVVQAEIAGAEKTIKKEQVKEMEDWINAAEKDMPLIKTFFISGGTEIASSFDFARTLARRAERRVVEVKERGDRKVGEHSLAFLNRLSSVLYALARLSNHKFGIKESAPKYN